MPNKSREEWKTYKNVFDNYTLRNLFKLQSQGHFEELQSQLAMGKEANVFLASHKEGHLVVVKIYRLETCDFNKMFTYLKTDPRYDWLKGDKRKTIFAWTQREYRSLMKARERIRVPTPHAIKDNIIVMEMIGGKDPANKIKDDTPKDPKAFFDELLGCMKQLWKLGIVHGDLSDFNILNVEQHPILIDFSQSTTSDDPMAIELLQRDCVNIANYFSKFGVETDAKRMEKEIRKKN